MKISREAILGAFVLATLSGCGSVYQKVEISDRTTLASLRVSKQIYAPKAARGALSDPETGVAVEVGLSGARGRDSFLLNSGEVRIGNTTFLAPQALDTRADVEILDVAARWRHLFSQVPVGYEVVLGTSHARLDVSVAGTGQSDTERFEATGFRFGAGAIWRMLPRTRLECRATVMFATYDFEELARYELFLVQSLGRNVAARAGYGFWRARTDVGGRSDVDVRLSGLSLGLDLNF